MRLLEIGDRDNIEQSILEASLPISSFPVSAEEHVIVISICHIALVRLVDTQTQR